MQAILNNEWLNHPAIEAGVAPFILALAIGALLPRRLIVWSTVVFAIGYFSAAWLILDGRLLSPLSSSRKLVLLGAAALIIGLIAHAAFPRAKHQMVWLLALAIAAVGWLIWPRLSRLDLWPQFLMAASCAIYTLWIVFAFQQMRDEDIATSVSASVLAFATGICALVGASSLLGELGLALSSAAAAVALFGLFTRTDHAASFSFPVAVLCTLIAIASVLYAKVPWYVLIALAAIPLLGMLFEWRYQNNMTRIFGLSLLIALPAAIAIIITRQVAGPIPI